MRSRPAELIRIDTLKQDPDFKVDEYFFKLVTAELRGKLKISLTRLRVESLTSGFYERERDATVFVSNRRQSSVDVLKRFIRSGGRPPVEVYWSALAPDGGGYVCPDSENVLGAYGELGFQIVPSRIMKPKLLPEAEGAIWIEARDSQAALAKVVSPRQPSSVPGIVDPTISDIATIVQQCTIASEDVRRSIREFNEPAGTNLHYHEMCYAVLRRHERLLNSLARLIGLGRLEHASMLARGAYEGFLNFYLDWLSPEFFGPRFQLLAAVRMSGSESPKEDLACLVNFVELMENTASKASLTPLSSSNHNFIYPALSRVAHQSYGYVEREATGFLDEELPDLSDSVRQVGLLMNAITAAFTVRILNDIGLGYPSTD